MSPVYIDGLNKRIAPVFVPLLIIIIILGSEVAAICSLDFVFFGFVFLMNIFGFLHDLQIWLPFLIAAPLAGLLAGLPAWRRYVIQAEHVTIKRGILVGCMVSIAAHPIMWMGVAAFGFLWNSFTHQQLTVATFSSFGMLFSFIAASLIYAGWITTIVGGITGALLICLQRALTQKSQRCLARNWLCDLPSS